MFKILSIDGGGIKGLYSAIILKEIEKSQGKINEHFDMICGTSTGGLIALALAVDIPLEAIVNFYKKKGPKIFPSQNLFSRSIYTLKQLFFSSKYNNKILNKALSEIFDDKLLDQSKTCVCIPAVDLSNFRGIVFKTSHQPHLTRDLNISMKDIALATSAAPTYFPIVSVPNVSSLCVDGGLWANNPSFVGIFEALSYFVGNDKSYKNLSILSLGNLSTDDGWSSRLRKASIFRWNKKLITLTLNSQSKSVESFLKIAADNNLFFIENYVRIPDPNMTEAHRKLITLDRTDKKALLAIQDIALKQAHEWKNRKEIKPFFHKKIQEWNFPLKNIKEEKNGRL